MEIACITGYTPTPENKRGISALIYWLLRERPAGVGVTIYTYNMNAIGRAETARVASELGVAIKPVALPRWYGRLSRLQKALDVLLPRPLVTYIRPDRRVLGEVQGADALWVYPYFFYAYAKALPHKKTVVTGCDCISNVCVRRAGALFYVRKAARDARQFFVRRNCINAERGFNRPNVLVHYVGLGDMMFYERLHNAGNAFFLLHPHYRLADKEIRFGAGKLSVLLAGEYNHYMQCDVDEMVGEMARQSDLQAMVRITFLGHGWAPVAQALAGCGYECAHKLWADDYAGELVRHDVQLAPISYGAGTKGKVLDAIGNGLLAIGSRYAFENICVRDRESCLVYRYAREIPGMLRSVALHRARYEAMAERGRRQVRTYHAPERISRRFFGIVERFARQAGAAGGADGA